MRYILVDRIKENNSNSVKGEKYISMNEDIFEQHFINFPVVPAAFMIESTIQLSKFFVWINTNYSLTLVAEEFDNFKFKGLISPGNILDLKVEFNKDVVDLLIDDEVVAKVEGYCNGKLEFKGCIGFKVNCFKDFHNEDKCKSLIKNIYK